MKLIDTADVLAVLGIAGIVLILAGFCAFMGKLEANRDLCKSDYKMQMAVDKAEKIPAALSNAVEHITSKGFVLTHLCIDKPVGSDDCIITAGGKDPGNVLKILDN